MSAEGPRKGDWTTYRRLLTYVTPAWFLFLIALLGYVVVGASEAYFVRVFGNIVEALGAPRPDDWWLLPALMMGAGLTRSLGAFVGEYVLSRISFEMVHKIRTELFDHLLGMPSAAFDRSVRGHLVSRITFNVAQMRDTATDALKTIIQDGSKVIILISAMLFANWRLTLIFLCVAPVVAAVVGYASARFRRISHRIQDSMGEVTQVAEETVNGYQVMRTFGGEDYERERFNAASNTNRQQHLKMVATKVLSTQVVQVFVIIALVTLFALLFQPQLARGMGAGDVVYFVGLAWLMAHPLRKLTDVNARLQRGLAAAEDVFSQLDEGAETSGGEHRVARVRGRIEFRDVTFGYESDRPVLKGLSFTIEPGQSVALVGKSGSGKTTVASLIPRFYGADSGKILIDDHPLNDFALDSLRAQIALVTQDVVLFNDTLVRNVAYGKLADKSPEALANAMRLAHVDEFVEDLPQGLETVLGDDGVRLSGGQRQRVAIARALLKDAPILILDEATSALDSESEQYIQSALEEVMRGRTTVVIAHRLSTIEGADLILVIDDGRIVERGTHAQLLAADGPYTLLYRSQYAGFDATGEQLPEPAGKAPAPIPLSQSAAPLERQFGPLVRAWYEQRFWPKLFKPLAAIYQLSVERRRLAFIQGKRKPWRAPVPVIVVGNLALGGTGKTPFVIWLATHLKRQGFCPGIVSRGYGGKAKSYPLEVSVESTPREVGDEGPMIVARTGAPMVVDPDRVAATRKLLEKETVDIVISDDGLQHYGLARDIEIIVLDGKRGLGNGLCLPAGPLREPAGRLNEVDAVVTTGQASHLVDDEWVMTLRPAAFVNVGSEERRAVDAFSEGRVHAVAGIGNPVRFRRTLESLGLDPELHAYPDHHPYTGSELNFGDGRPVIVTEKDAVKIRELPADALPWDLWYLEIEAEMTPAVTVALDRVLAAHGIVPGRSQSTARDASRETT